MAESTSESTQEEEVRFFKRTYYLIFGNPSKGEGLEINGDEDKNEGLQISFRVRKFLNNSEQPNLMELEVTNLSEENINYIKKETETLSLSVGYGGNNLLLFTGNILEVESAFHKGGSPDKVTKIICTPSSGIIYNPSLSKTFPAGTTVKAVVDYVVSTDKDLVKSSYNSVAMSKKFPFGYTVHGTGKQVLDNLSRDFNFTYRIDQNRLSISDHGEYQSKSTKGNAFLLTWETGLKKGPTYASPDGKKISLSANRKKTSQEKLKEKHAGIKCTAFLNPLLVPAAAIKLEGTDHDGVYRISGSDFTGDWRSSDKWDVELYCTKID